MAAPAWQIVARREVSVRLRDRNFIISMAVIVALVAASFAISAVMSNRDATTKVAVVQNHADAAAVVEAARQAETSKAYEAVSVPNEAAAKDEVRSGGADVALLATDDGFSLVGDKEVSVTTETDLALVARQLALDRNAKQQGVDLAALAKGAEVKTSTLQEPVENEGVVQITAMVFTFIFYMVMLLFGMPIAQSVTEEKQSRIVEILASAIPLRQLLIGKIIGNTLLVFVQLLVLGAVAVIGLQFTQWKDSVGVVAQSSGWFVAFFVIGFLVVASLYAVAGALASRQEDLQSTTMPMTTVIILALLLGLNAKGVWLTIASYVPVVSTVLMPKRLLEGEAAAWEPFVALVVVLVAAAAVAQFATKIYTRSVMQTGRLGYRDAMRLED